MKNIKLADSARLQSSAYTNRAAALFPIFDINKCDLLFLFDDYWRWKRNIDVEFRISVRKRCGALVWQTSLCKPSPVNIISLKELIPPLFLDDLYEGTAEIEILATCNLVFSFPAILGYYVSLDGYVSVVHSCGRTLQSSDETSSQSFSEGGFYLNFDHFFKPFVHLFNGPFGTLSQIQLVLDVFSGNAVHTTSYNLNDLIDPYESRLIFIDEIIGKDKVQELIELKSVDSSYGLPAPIAVARIQGEAQSCYARWLCGNFDTINNYPLVAHTFREITNQDDILEVRLPREASKMVIPGYPEFLSLLSVIYPYASPSTCCTNLNVRELGNNNLSRDYKLDLSRASARIFNYRQLAGDLSPRLFSVMPLQDAKSIPARITANHSFFFPGNPRSYTDIALGFTPSIAADKRNYWFTFLTLPEWSIFLLLSSCKEEGQCDTPIHFVLHLSCKSISENLSNECISKRDFLISASVINLSQIIKQSCALPYAEIRGIACRIEVLSGKLNDVYALGTNKTIESVYGEHSF